MYNHFHLTDVQENLSVTRTKVSPIAHQLKIGGLRSLGSDQFVSYPYKHWAFLSCCSTGGGGGVHPPSIKFDPDIPEQ